MTRKNAQSRFIEECYSRYPKQKLGGHISVIRGVSYKPSDIRSSVDEGVAIILRSNNIADGEINFDDLVYVVQERVQNEQKLKPGDIVMCGSNGSISLVGKAGLLKDNMPNTAFGAFCLGIKCKETILPEYLNTYFKTQVYRNEIESTGNGTNIINIRPDNITSLSIPIPPVDKQKAFVEVVKRADKSKFNGFKSRFIEQFSGDSISRVPLADLCTLFIDGDWIEAKDQSDSGYRLVQTGNIGICEYLDKEDHSRYVNDETFKRLNCTEIHSGDILFSRLPDPIGRCCIIPRGFPKAITAVDCTITRLKDNCLPEYLMVYTTTTMYSEQIKKCITGTTRQRISRGNLAKITVPLPDKQLQAAFVSLVHQADKSKYLN